MPFWNTVFSPIHMSKSTGFNPGLPEINRLHPHGSGGAPGARLGLQRNNSLSHFGSWWSPRGESREEEGRRRSLAMPSQALGKCFRLEPAQGRRRSSTSRTTIRWRGPGMAATKRRKRERPRRRGRRTIDRKRGPMNLTNAERGLRDGSHAAGGGCVLWRAANIP